MILLETTILKLVSIVKQRFYNEILKIIATDNVFRESLLEIEKLVNVKYAFTTETFSEDYFFSLNEFELDALIRTFTLLDGVLEEFSYGIESVVPQLFYRLRELDYKNYEELADWVFKNRKNINIGAPDLGAKAAFNDARSLREYRLLSKLINLKSQIFSIQNNIKGIENQLKNPNKVTDDLIDAMRRNDSATFDKLVEKGAELYLVDEDGVSIGEKLENLKNEIYNRNTGYRYLELEDKFDFCDSKNNKLVIKIRDFKLTLPELEDINCVSITARYDHGFGFSQLYRFVFDKDNQIIKDLCDEVHKKNKSKLLPNELSKWKVFLTPIVKGNGKKDKELCSKIMSDIIKNSNSESILITQFSFMYSFKEQQFDGIFEVIKEMKKTSFGNLKILFFEIDTRYKNMFIDQLRSKLRNDGW